MIEVNEKRLDFEAIIIIKTEKMTKGKKELYKPAERERFIVRITEISDLTARNEAMLTLDCLMNGRKVEVRDREISLYSSNKLFRPVWTITDNPELISLLEELVR